MTRIHTVAQGESVWSIAADNNLYPETIWDHPDNAELRELRGCMDLLHPGDELSVPEPEVKQESGASGSRHKFRRKGVPEKLTLYLRDPLGTAKADTPYRLDIDGKLFEGETDDDGLVEEWVPTGATGAKLFVNGSEQPVRIKLRHLDPVDAVTGVQARLRSLGFDCGPVDGDAADRTTAAIRAFQDACELDVTGELDDATRDRLVQEHGC